MQQAYLLNQLALKELKAGTIVEQIVETIVLPSAYICLGIAADIRVLRQQRRPQSCTSNLDCNAIGASGMSELTLQLNGGVTEQLQINFQAVMANTSLATVTLTKKSRA